MLPIEGFPVGSQNVVDAAAYRASILDTPTWSVGSADTPHDGRGPG